MPRNAFFVQPLRTVARFRLSSCPSIRSIHQDILIEVKEQKNQMRLANQIDSKKNEGCYVAVCVAVTIRLSLVLAVEEE